MKTLFTLLLLSICLIGFGQTVLTKKQQIVVTPNPIQVEKLNAAYKTDVEVHNRIEELTELIIGYKLNEVDSLRVDNGQFKFVLKPKRK